MFLIGIPEIWVWFQVVYLGHESGKPEGRGGKGSPGRVEAMRAALWQLLAVGSGVALPLLWGRLGTIQSALALSTGSTGCWSTNPLSPFPVIDRCPEDIHSLTLLVVCLWEERSVAAQERALGQQAG